MMIFNTVFFCYKQLPASAAEDVNFIIKKELIGRASSLGRFL